jgi:uncharacterized protein YbjT (DUF2867 family)
MAGSILVTGATGEIGRELIPQLVAADQPLRALVRDPAKADFDQWSTWCAPIYDIRTR